MKTKWSIRTTALAMLMASAMLMGTPTMAANNQPIGCPTGGDAATEAAATLTLVQQHLAAVNSPDSCAFAVAASLTAVNGFLAKHGNNQSDPIVQLMLIARQQLEAAAIVIINANSVPAAGTAPMPSVQSLPVPPMMPNAPMMMPNLPMMPGAFETTDTIVTPGCGSFTRRCMSCKGSGSCKICYGTGRVTGSYGSGRWDCTACKGTGRCTICGN